ncbi:MAG: cupredoxin domain-containing protein [Actinomycetota bacterium]|nr:cupredoxin domain-containing protein [Actinomycetota bacterium]MDK1017643.1 cupredoxin domain-containing protein [Actinomycetota bacterium]MDK1027518.1 cupredoxin domain-containing protein [Actinomycetota bacterium]MDK1038345.1 cupredoxin domain-containing protein [Actinomycetota bacterium]MDK1097423.1 cupredoxin domain-containing protein [Actinomycetota bacterium]
MKNRTLLAVGIGAIVLAFVGPALAGTFNDHGSVGWGPFDQMRSRHVGGHMGAMGRAMMGGVSGDFGSGDVPPSIEGAAEITVTLDDFSISPSMVVVMEGQATNITVVNNGSAPHDFTVPALGIRIEVAPGETVTAGIEAQAAGTYDTLCTIAGHESLGMVGGFVVESQA